MEQKDSVKIVEKLFYDLEETMSYLYERWQDEKEYEDIKDYAKPIIPKVEEIGGKFISMSKRPFGFKFEIDNFVYHFCVNSSSYWYKKPEKMEK